MQKQWHKTNKVSIAVSILKHANSRLLVTLLVLLTRIIFQTNQNKAAASELTNHNFYKSIKRSFNSFIVCQAKFYTFLTFFATNFKILPLLDRKIFIYIFSAFC